MYEDDNNKDEQNDSSDISFIETHSQFDIPTPIGGWIIWDTLVERHGVPLVGIGREELNIPDNSTNIRYQFRVADEYLELEHEETDGGDGIGWVTPELRQLREALRNVADQHRVTKERVRQACMESYTSQDNFIEDLENLERRYREHQNQNSDNSVEDE